MRFPILIIRLNFSDCVFSPLEKAKLYKAKADAYWNEYRIVRERDVETLGDEAAYASDSESQVFT